MRPYLIAIGDYTHNSAGVRVMHKLADELERKGYPAWTVGRTFYNSQAGQITMEYLHFLLNANPIVVYPEIVAGNPFNLNSVVRYVLNIPGKLGGNKEYAASEKVFVYSSDLLPYVRSHARVLYTPVVERELFNNQKSLRTGGLFWVGKSQLREPNPPKGFNQITYQWPAKRSELARLLQTSEVLYCYDTYSALALEAPLCGCPVVMIPEPGQDRDEYKRTINNLNGIAWGTEPSELERARKTMDLVSLDYDAKVQQFNGLLDQFILETQAM